MRVLCQSSAAFDSTNSLMNINFPIYCGTNVFKKKNIISKNEICQFKSFSFNQVRPGDLTKTI